MAEYRTRTCELLLLLCLTFFWSWALPSIASVHESFYLIPKDKCNKFCEQSKLVPNGKKWMIDQTPGIHVVTKAEMKSPEYRKEQRVYGNLWKYLDANGKQPFKYSWSGGVLSEVLGHLVEENQIDLLEHPVLCSVSDWHWYVFDKALKDKYLKRLNPSNFRDVDLMDTYNRNRKEQREKFILEVKNKLTKHEYQSLLENPPREDFPERGKAMMDGIKYLYQYLEQVDDNTVVLLHFG